MLQRLPHLNLNLPTSVTETDLACGVGSHTQWIPEAFQGAGWWPWSQHRLWAEPHREGGWTLGYRWKEAIRHVVVVGFRPAACLPSRCEQAALPWGLWCLHAAGFQLDPACEMKGQEGKNFTLRTYGDDPTRPTWAPGRINLRRWS